MRVITLAARKGGVGKTLLTASLAVLAAQQRTLFPTGGDGHRGVAVVDLDPQGSLTSWHNRRGATWPAIAQLDPADLPAGLANLAAAGIDTVFLDTPPGHSDIVTAAIRAATITVVPVKPGPLDLEAALATAAIAVNLMRSHTLLPSDATFRSVAMGQTIWDLARLGLPTLPPLHHRVDAALNDGRAVSERAPGSRAAAEQAHVWATLDRLTASLEMPW